MIEYLFVDSIFITPVSWNLLRHVLIIFFVSLGLSRTMLLKLTTN